MVAAQMGNAGTQDEQEAALAEKMRLVNERHMPCPPEAVAVLLDGYLAPSPRPVAAKLVPIRNDHGLHWAWVVSVDNRVVEVVTGPLSEPAARSAPGAASAAIARAREFIADHREHRSDREPRKTDEPPIPPERLTARHQERSYGLQIVAIELSEPAQMRWRVTALPVRKHTLGGEIWMRFTPKSLVSAEFGR